MRLKISDRIFSSGISGAKVATFGFFAGNVLGVSAVKSIGSWGIAAGAGFTGAALTLLPAIILRTLAKSSLRLNADGMLVLDLGLTFASAALGAYCFGIAMTSMLICAALGVGISLLLDYADDFVQKSLFANTRATANSDVIYSVGQFRV